MTVRGYLLFSLFIGFEASAVSYSNLYTFGDSLSDTGNAHFFTGGSSNPDPPYFSGRFSNGPVWIETVGATLGHDTSPSLGGFGGDNWAFGGATAGGTLNSFTTQVNGYLVDSGGSADQNALYAVWFGGNDVNNASASSDITSALSFFQSNINTLYNAGARNFLIPNLPDIGQTPGSIAAGSTAQNQATNFTNIWNSGLANIVSALGNNGATVNLVDIADEFDQMINNPQAFGLTNVTDGAFLQSPSVTGTSANSYLFVDSLHPSQTGHDLTAAASLQSAVPEPSGALLVIVGFTALLHRRSRH